MSEQDQPPTPRMTSDRLYGVSIRPQELAVYGENVRFDLRYAPIYDDADEAVTEHFKLMVLEVSCEVPPDDELRLPARRLELVKCGWELSLETDRPWPSAKLPTLEGEVRHVLDRIADTVNELARRGGLEIPMGEEVVADIAARFGPV